MGRLLRLRKRKVDHFDRYKKDQKPTESRFAGKPIKGRGKAAVSQRERAKEMRKLKKEYGLNRSQIGAIGAGHMKPPWE